MHNHLIIKMGIKGARERANQIVSRPRNLNRNQHVHS